MGSTRLEDEWCPVARRLRAELEGPLDLSAIAASHRVAVTNRAASTLHEDAHDSLLVRMRAESGEIGAQKLILGRPF